MKALSILVATSLAFTPAIAYAGPDTSNTNSRPISGPLAGRALDDSGVPVPVIFAGAILLIGGAAMGALAGGGGSSNSTNSTNSTNNSDETIAFLFPL